MIEAFEDNEDIKSVSSNEIMNEVLEKKAEEFIEKNRFQT